MKKNKKDREKTPEKNLKEKLENLIKEIEKTNYPETIPDRLAPSLKISEIPQQAKINLENEFKDISSDKKSEERLYQGIKRGEQEKKYIGGLYCNQFTASTITDSGINTPAKFCNERYPDTNQPQGIKSMGLVEY